jgi:hypothetical protein
MRTYWYVLLVVLPEYTYVLPYVSILCTVLYSTVSATVQTNHWAPVVRVVGFSTYCLRTSSNVHSLLIEYLNMIEMRHAAC